MKQPGTTNKGAGKGRVGGWRNGAVTSLWLLAAAVCLAAAVWLVAAIDVGPPEQADWHRAAQRIETRLGTGELVVVHRPGKVWYAEPLRGLPAVCAPGKRGPKLEHLRKDAVWIIGEKKFRHKLRKLTRGFKRKGTTSFGGVHLLHAWDRKGAGK